MEQFSSFNQAATVAPDRLTLGRARELACFLAARLNAFAELKECRIGRQDGAHHEMVFVDVEVEVPQYPTHDICHSEPLVVVFTPGDEAPPAVFALRPDFPRVPHLNLLPSGFPPSLCLYDRPFNEVLIDWTAPKFVERIRQWLSQTATGTLHADDQPLEPLLYQSDPIADLIVPEETFSVDFQDTPAWLSIQMVPRGPLLFTAISQPLNVTDLPDELSCIALVVSCPPQVHGVINHRPDTLQTLHDLTADSGLNLIQILREELRRWLKDSEGESHRLLGVRLALIVRLPKMRAPGRPTEVVEVRAFMVTENVGEVGGDIGVWEMSDGRPGLLISPDETKVGQSTILFPLNAHAAFSRSQAADANGLGPTARVSMAAIGVGALGSQVVSNLVRSGFGQWALIDGDMLLPHNLARHALDGLYLGWPKALALAGVSNGIIDGARISDGIVADVLRPGENSLLVQSALSEAEVILDMSANIPVARYLSRDVDSKGRRISLFLNPSGTALTLLAEDRARRIPLDVLEMQLYREIADNPELSGLLESTGRLRTGQSCRDLSTQIPQDLVALQAAIGSHAVRRVLDSELAQISTWRVEPNTHAVSAIQSKPAQPTKRRLGKWTVYMDSQLQEKLADLRRERLPNETGGVLIGASDMLRRVIYVVGAIASPKDSEESPTSYVRGSKDLEQRVSEISKTTTGMLGYIGEWHSHPDGASVRPSAKDRALLAWIKSNMQMDGTPGVMAIVGEDGRIGLHLADPTLGNVQ